MELFSDEEVELTGEQTWPSRLRLIANNLEQQNVDLGQIWHLLQAISNEIHTERTNED